jgi:beta-lactam-binding protein with PASTA domain
VTIPDLTGESERAATISVRRLSLELGTVAYLAVPGDPDVVLTQTPPVNAAGVDGPRVSLLVSDPGDAQPPAYAMPSLLGLSYAAASARVSIAGLHLVEDSTNTGSAAPAGPAGPGAAATVAPPAPSAASVGGAGIVVAQYPQPGHRVLQGDAVHIAFGAPTPPVVTQ